jgi:Uma2 family endonuclease
MQTFADEITLPETKPETEWIDGHAVPKVMPTREHGILQGAFFRVLDDWSEAGGRGQVATEWRFRVAIPGTVVHPLVPDVAFMSFARLRSLPKDERTYPLIAPEIVVEILSPDDRQPDVEAKRKDYLAWGVSLVLIVNYETRSTEAYDSEGGYGTIGAVEDYSPMMFPDLRLPMRTLFAKLDVPE